MKKSPLLPPGLRKQELCYCGLSLAICRKGQLGGDKCSLPWHNSPCSVVLQKDIAVQYCTVAHGCVVGMTAADSVISRPALAPGHVRPCHVGSQAFSTSKCRVATCRCIRVARLLLLEVYTVFLALPASIITVTLTRPLAPKTPTLTLTLHGRSMPTANSTAHMMEMNSRMTET